MPSIAELSGWDIPSEPGRRSSPSGNGRRYLMRGLPLYRGVGFFERHESEAFDHDIPIEQPHPGLVFDKFIDTWQIGSDGSCHLQAPARSTETRPASKAAQQGSKRCFYEVAAGYFQRDRKGAVPSPKYLDPGLARYLQRHEALLNALGGKGCDATVDWRFVSGLGTGHPFETGFIWHRTLGVPYLPGSSVKGMIRAWAESWGGESDEKLVRDMFGPRGKKAETNPAAGALIVFDALPLRFPRLQADIVNPHYKAYYEGQIDRRTGKPIPPADYLSPTPITFIAVRADQKFRFSLAPRPGDPKGHSLLERGIQLLTTALSTIGAGGKTAVGYGVFRPDEP